MDCAWATEEYSCPCRLRAKVRAERRATVRGRGSRRESGKLPQVFRREVFRKDGFLGACAINKPLSSRPPTFGHARRGGLVGVRGGLHALRARRGESSPSL